MGTQSTKRMRAAIAANRAANGEPAFPGMSATMPSLGRRKPVQAPAPGVNLTLTIVFECIAESGRKLVPGDTCEYRGHVAGGMVRVELPDGTTDVIHPHATKELRS